MDGYYYCRACQGRAVTTSADVTGLGNLLRSSLSPRGCWLPHRVPLRIESPGAAARGQDFDVHLLGWTSARFLGPKLMGQEISVRYGLPDEVCLFTLAHEYGHAVLNHHGKSPIPDLWSEGFCQFLAGIVLREHRRGRPEAQRRLQLELGRGGIYGQGMRTVTQAAQRHGEASVIAAFATGSPASLRMGRS